MPSSDEGGTNHLIKHKVRLYALSSFVLAMMTVLTANPLNAFVFQLQGVVVFVAIVPALAAAVTGCFSAFLAVRHCCGYIWLPLAVAGILIGASWAYWASLATYLNLGR